MSAAGAADKVLYLLERKPKIDLSTSTSGDDVEIQGKVEFEQVSFSYPTRPCVPGS